MSRKTPRSKKPKEEVKVKYFDPSKGIYPTPKNPVIVTPLDHVTHLTVLEINSILMIQGKYPEGIRPIEYTKEVNGRTDLNICPYFYGGVQLRRLQRKGCVKVEVRKKGKYYILNEPIATSLLSYVDWDKHDFSIYSRDERRTHKVRRRY